MSDNVLLIICNIQSILIGVISIFYVFMSSDLKILREVNNKLRSKNDQQYKDYSDSLDKLRSAYDADLKANNEYRDSLLATAKNSLEEAEYYKSKYIEVVTGMKYVKETKFDKNKN